MSSLPTLPFLRRGASKEKSEKKSVAINDKLMWTPSDFERHFACSAFAQQKH